MKLLSIFHPNAKDFPGKLKHDFVLWPLSPRCISRVQLWVITRTLFALELRSRNWQACILVLLVIFILISFYLPFFCEFSGNKGKLVFENNLFHIQNALSCRAFSQSLLRLVIRDRNCLLFGFLLVSKHPSYILYCTFHFPNFMKRQGLGTAGTMQLKIREVKRQNLWLKSLIYSFWHGEEIWRILLKHYRNQQTYHVHYRSSHSEVFHKK